jgi:selenocysteine-specific elongation factor
LVVEAHPRARHRRRDAALLAQLALLLRGSPADALLQSASSPAPAPIKDIVASSGLPQKEAAAALSDLLEAGTLVMLEEGAPAPASDLLAMPSGQWDGLRARVSELVSAYHGQYPLRPGIPREELKSRLQLSPRAFNAAVRKLVKAGNLVETGQYLALRGHKLEFDPDQQRRVDALLAKFAAAPFAPPSVKECQAQVGEDVYAAMLAMGVLVAVSPEVVFRTMDYDLMVKRITGFIREHGQISVAETRDLFDNSRKYSLAILEHLDATGVTMRQGDYRILRKP